MNDAEIIKALECCSHEAYDCDVCPLNLKEEELCFIEVRKYALDLINRKNAEIERLNFVRTRDAQRYEQKISDQAHTNCVLYDLHSDAIKEVKALEDELKTAKAEAIKEFAERLKLMAPSMCWDTRTEYFFSIKNIDNLVKEMAGDTE